MNAMNMPGFTAEASFVNVSMRYQATNDASSFRELVRPAWIFSDTFDPNEPVACVKEVCALVHRPLENPRIVCWWEGGYLDSSTGICT
jgi:hypothetical protein